LHPVHQLGDIVRRQRRTRRKRRSGGVDETDGDEILLGVERKIRVKRHARRQRHLVQQHRITVGRGAGSAGGGDHPAGAANVFDDDLLAERLRHAVLDDARDRIGRAAGRVGDHERDRTAGVSLRRCRAGDRDTRGEKRGRERPRRRAADKRDELAPLHSEHRPCAPARPTSEDSTASVRRRSLRRGISGNIAEGKVREGSERKRKEKKRKEKKRREKKRKEKKRKEKKRKEKKRKEKK